MERRELEQKVACLQDRLQRFANTCLALAVDPYNVEAAGIEDAADPREDIRELRKACDRLTEIRKLLD